MNANTLTGWGDGGKVKVQGISTSLYLALYVPIGKLSPQSGVFFCLTECNTIAMLE
jgi:hypothetical protein